METSKQKIKKISAAFYITTQSTGNLYIRGKLYNATYRIYPYYAQYVPRQHLFWITAGSPSISILIPLQVSISIQMFAVSPISLLNEDSTCRGMWNISADILTNPLPPLPNFTPSEPTALEIGWGTGDAWLLSISLRENRLSWDIPHRMALWYRHSEFMCKLIHHFLPVVCVPSKCCSFQSIFQF